jgi:ABC-type multidrug transport system fused ATPase/permease subunit
MQEVSMNLKKISLLSIVYSLPLALIMLIIYRTIWPESIMIIDVYFENLKPLNNTVSVLKALFPMFVIFIGVIIHEFIHILFFVFFNQNGWATVKVGFKMKTFTPYAHCSEPIKLRHYVITSALPGIILGLIPFVISLIIGNPWLWVFSLVLSIGAIGDFIIISKTRHIGLNKYVLDHTHKAGFIVI